MYPIRKTTKNWILPAMVLRPCVQLNTGEYNLRLQTAPAKLYNKSTDISRKRWSEQMDMENLIGETTEYDKKAALEVKSPKAGAKVSALLRTRWAVR